MYSLPARLVKDIAPVSRCVWWRVYFRQVSKSYRVIGMRIQCREIAASCASRFDILWRPNESFIYATSFSAYSVDLVISSGCLLGPAEEGVGHAYRVSINLPFSICHLLAYMSQSLSPTEARAYLHDTVRISMIVYRRLFTGRPHQYHEVTTSFALVNQIASVRP